MADKGKFSTMRNGYNRYEVDDVVMRLTGELEMTKKQLDGYRELANQANEQLVDIKERYTKLVSQIEIRERAADDISRLALKEANRVISSAQSNADSIVQEAIVTAKQLLIEISRLSTEAMDAKEDMQAKLNELQQLLDDFKLPNTIDEKWLKD